MKKLAIAFVAAACLTAPVQAMAQSKPAPAMPAMPSQSMPAQTMPAMEDSKMARADGWTSNKILAVAGGAVVGVIAAEVLLPAIMMKNAIGLVGGAVLGYYWYNDELPRPMNHRASDEVGDAKVVLAKM